MSIGPAYASPCKKRQKSLLSKIRDIGQFCLLGGYPGWQVFDLGLHSKGTRIAGHHERHYGSDLTYSAALVIS
jgi:hypothetical protein